MPLEPLPLARIQLKGYKSIRLLEKLDLDPQLNILIGANGSGKSNFIRFFELLSQLMNRQLQSYISEHGGADAYLHKGMKITPEIEAHLWFGLNEYIFSLKGADDRTMYFSRELAPFQGPVYGAIVNDQGSGHRESALAGKVGPSASEKRVIENVRSWRVYHFHDTSPGARVMGRWNSVDNEVLLRDAANVSAVLLKMRKEAPEHYRRIEESVRQVAPFFQEFAISENQNGQTQLLWKDRKSDTTYYPFQLSDGTLRYICLCTLLLQPNPPTTIIIDEPELGLHPYAIKQLAGLLYGASLKSQLIVATQSSALVDEFEPHHLIVVDCKEDESELKRLDPDKMAEWLTEYTLGQLWEKNVFDGGVP